jgi:ERF superfamily
VSEEPKIAEKPQPQLNLTQKLCAVGKALTWIKKRGENTFHGYKYATESDLVLAIRMELYNRNVFLLPNVIETKREGRTDEKGKYKAITDMNIEWTWLDGDSGEKIVSHMPGCGEDSGDKGTYKAITGSEKYLLLKTFLIPTYDDAEKMAPADKKELQKRIATEKVAAGNARKAAETAQTEEDAATALKKGKVLFLRLPDRFNGEFTAVYGAPIADLKVELFMNDCAASRFKGPEGVFYKLPVQYAKDCKALGEQLGYTVDAGEL